MTTLVRKPRGRPFKPGNPGRPLGSKNKTTQLVEQLAEDQAEQIIRKLFERAQDGDVSCLRMIVDRLWPPRKGQPVSIVMPPIKSLQDVVRAIPAIWTGIQEGQLTPGEAADLSTVADRIIHAIELHDITKRIEALEKARDKRHGQQDDPPPA
jgi:hypothetical protein